MDLGLKDQCNSIVGQWNYEEDSWFLCFFMSFEIDDKGCND